MKKNNMKVRAKILESGLAYYEVAAMLGVSDNTLFRWMRSEMPYEKQIEIANVIQRWIDSEEYGKQLEKEMKDMD